MNFGGLNTFDNVTAESLVILAGVIDGDKIAPEGLEYRILQAQVCCLFSLVRFKND